MPPKKQAQAGGSKKVEQKKIIEDKTFRLKNKKGAKQQKFIKAVVDQKVNASLILKIPSILKLNFLKILPKVTDIILSIYSA